MNELAMDERVRVVSALVEGTSLRATERLTGVGRQAITSLLLTVRRLVHRMGYRYRLHVAGLPGKPDLVFPSRRRVIFVHGCFWHGHTCRSGTVRPQANAAFWSGKLDRNKERDTRNLAALAEAGWSALVVWGCELRDEDALRARLATFLGERGM